jgi:hypothetical protein
MTDKRNRKRAGKKSLKEKPKAKDGSAAKAGDGQKEPDNYGGMNFSNFKKNLGCG